MAEVDTFGATKLDIEQYVEHRVNALVEAELTVGRVSDLLGTLLAIEGATRRLMDIERRAAQLEANHEALAQRIAGAAAAEQALLEERAADQQVHLELLAATRFDLTARIEKLAQALRG